MTTAVARGDLSRKITVDVKGEILELKNTINTMVDQLNAFAGEVTRVAREVGTEGKLGGQAQVPGVAGTWKDLTDNVNVMAANLTEQVRGIVKVVTAVADGDLKQSLTVQAKGEVAALAETINDMTGTLAIFADQVTTVAREVGVEGRLGGQANVPGAAGTWKDLTGNVNLLAANLTTQVRAIAEVATAVTKGDLTRSIQVDARGEVAELKDNINTMIDNLRLTTDRNNEQDWLKTNLARFTGLLQGQRDLATVGRTLLTELVPLVDAHQGLIYQMATDGGPHLKLLASYGNAQSDGYPDELDLGEGFLGQCAVDKRRILVTNVPSDTVPVGSTLFQALPKSLIVLPVLFEGQIKAVLGLASLREFASSHLTFLEQLTSNMGIVVNSIEATMQTEGLLKQSQQLAAELQTQQKELQQTNEQLEQKAQQLAEQNAEVERKNKEIELARQRRRGEGRGARAHLEVQVRVPGQHVSRAAHPAQQHPHPGPAAGRQPRRQPDRQAGRVLTNDPQRGHRPAQPDQRHPRPLEDRVGNGHGRGRRDPSSRTSWTPSNAHSATRPRTAAFPSTCAPMAGSAAAWSPTRSASCRCSRTCFRTPSSSPSAAGSRSTVRSVASGWSQDHPGAQRAAAVVAFEVADTGVGIPAREAEDHLRGVPAGRRQHQPQVRGHGARPRDQPRARLPAGGRDPAPQRPRRRAAPSPCTFPLRYVGPATEGRPSASARSGPSAVPRSVRVPERIVEPVPDDRETITAGDSVMLVVEDDPHYARVLVGSRARTGLQGARGDARGRRP